MVRPVNRPQCVGEKADGTRCSLPATTGSAFCFGHDPACAKKRQVRSRKAGRTTAKNRKKRAREARLEPRKKKMEAKLAEMDVNAVIERLVSHFGVADRR